MASRTSSPRNPLFPDAAQQRGSRILATPNTPLPKVALLGRAPFTTMVTAAGGSACRNGDVAINRWRNDCTTDDHGQWCYLRNLDTGKVWSTTHQPVCVAADSYRVALADDMVTVSRTDGQFETLTQIVVESDARTEARKVIVTNHSETRATVELTSYQEIVIAPHVSDRGHRAFSNLFVQTEWLPKSTSVLAMRRPRSAMDTPTWAGHTVATVSPKQGSVSCETDRAGFIGRGRTSRNPVAMGRDGDLAGTVGAVLDPVLALRLTLVIEAGDSAQAIFTTYLATDREDAERLAAQYHDVENAQQFFDRDVEERSSVQNDSGGTPEDASRFQELAGTLLYGIRPPGSVGSAGTSKPDRADLLAIGITGEYPILLATLNSPGGAERAQDLLRMHRYWRLKGVACDLVFVCGEASEEVADSIKSNCGTSLDDSIDRPRGVWILRRDVLDVRQLSLLRSIARISVDCDSDSDSDSNSVPANG